MGSYRMCVCFTRRYRITEAEPPSDVKEAFKKYSEGGTHMNAEQLRRFLAEVQADEPATVDDAERILEEVHRRRHHHITKFRKHSLTLDDFHHYLFSADFNPPISDQVLILCFFSTLFLMITDHHSKKKRKKRDWKE